MNKYLLIAGSLLISTLGWTAEPLTSRDAVINSLRNMNPADILPGFTSTPKEIQLQPEENNDTLPASGLQQAQTNPMAEQALEVARNRPDIVLNPESPEMKLAAELIESSEDVLHGACYQTPGECEQHTESHTCETRPQYSPQHCRSVLNVTLKTLQHTFTRTISRIGKMASLSLSQCAPQDTGCGGNNRLQINANCQSLTLQATLNGKSLPVIQAPTCQNPVAILLLTSAGRDITLNVSERITEDNWSTQICTGKTQSSHCVLQSQGVCTAPHTTRVIDGLSITRPCWEKTTQFQCISSAHGNCNPWLAKGCSQTASVCAESKDNLCIRYTQTFQCMTQTCLPQKTVCPEPIACADGSCGQSLPEESDDINQGIGRLGALAGSAQSVADNQINTGMPGIFKGEVQQCKKYPLGIRDCCTDSGWGDWVKHCPDKLKALQRAKAENRVVDLGHYQKHTLGSERYVYCVFPTRLSAIIQKQGRLAQLGIGFGAAKTPDCRGLMPEELERIDFGRLDLSPVEAELLARLQLPTSGGISLTNQAHVERLHGQGISHD